MTTTTTELVPNYLDVTRLAVGSFLARYRKPTLTAYTQDLKASQRGSSFSMQISTGLRRGVSVRPRTLVSGFDWREVWVIDEVWLRALLDEAARRPMAEDAATLRMRELLQSSAVSFAARRPDVRSPVLAEPRRGLHPDEAASFLRAVDSGVAIVDDAGFVTLPTLRPKSPPGRYALLSRNGSGVSINLEYLVQIGATAELVLDWGWPGALIDFERGEFDALARHTAGRVVLAMEAKARATGADSLEKLVRSWLTTARSGADAPLDNAGRKYNELLRLCQSGPVAVWLVAAGVRWVLQATTGATGINLEPASGDVAYGALGGAPRLSDSSAPCKIHELSNCGLCHPVARDYRRGRSTLEVPTGHYVEIRGGKGVYHHPDCYNVTGE